MMLGMFMTDNDHLQVIWAAKGGHYVWFERNHIGTLARRDLFSENPPIVHAVLSGPSSVKCVEYILKHCGQKPWEGSCVNMYTYDWIGSFRSHILTMLGDTISLITKHMGLEPLPNYRPFSFFEMAVVHPNFEAFKACEIEMVIRGTTILPVNIFQVMLAEFPTKVKVIDMNNDMLPSLILTLAIAGSKNLIQFYSEILTKYR